MKHLVARCGALSLGLISGLIGTLLLINVVFARDAVEASTQTPTINRIAGPPPLALRLSGGPAHYVYLPVILNSP